MFLALEDGYFPNDTDVYNPHLPNFGNTNYGKSDKFDTLFWDGSKDSFVDIRLFYVFRDKD
jgi:hypothetical protein